MLSQKHNKYAHSQRPEKHPNREDREAVFDIADPTSTSLCWKAGERTERKNVKIKGNLVTNSDGLQHQ